MASENRGALSAAPAKGTQRLPSFSASDDAARIRRLLLREEPRAPVVAGNGLVASSKKKTFVPNLNVQRSKAKKEKMADRNGIVTNGTQINSSSNERGGKREESAKKINNDFKKPTYIQANGGLFSEGLGESTAKSRFSSGFRTGGKREASGGVASETLEKPVIKKSPVFKGDKDSLKKEKEEEAMTYDQLLNSDFISDQKVDLAFAPLTVPLLKKEESGQSKSTIVPKPIQSLLPGMMNGVTQLESAALLGWIQSSCNEDDDNKEFIVISFPGCLPVMGKDGVEPLTAVNPGKIGTFEVNHRGQGRIVLEGGKTLMLRSGVNTPFLQKAVCLSPDRGEVLDLGPIHQQLIAVPDFFGLLKDGISTVLPRLEEFAWAVKQCLYRGLSTMPGSTSSSESNGLFAFSSPELSRTAVEVEGSLLQAMHHLSSSGHRNPREYLSDVNRLLSSLIDEYDNKRHLLDRERELFLAARTAVTFLPHSEKFHDPRIREVFDRSLEPRDFRELAEAWSSLFKYAINIRTKPWRKEYATIWLFGGYYKHHVANVLPDGYRILQILGYNVDGNICVLKKLPDSESLFYIARDCLLAKAECRIMDLQKRMAPDFEWADISGRRNPTLPFQHMRHGSQQSEPLLPLNGTRQGSVAVGKLVDVVPSSISPFENDIGIPSPSYTGTPFSPHSPDAYISSARGKSQEDYLPYSSAPHSHYVVDKNFNDLSSFSNSQHKLLGSAQPRDNRTFKKVGNQDNPGLTYLNDFEKANGAERAKKGSSFGSRENTRNIVGRAYVKDTRKPLNITTSNPQIPFEHHEGPNVVVHKIHIEQPRQPNRAVITDTSSPLMPSNELPHSATTRRTDATDQSARKLTKKDAEHKEWNCHACTFLNVGDAKTCQVCAKSRIPENKSLTIGGKECSKCTYVNQRHLNLCEMCDTSLEGCSTYT